MTDRELMQQALDALGRVTKEMLACKDALAERGGRPVNNKQHQSLWDSAHDAYVDVALPAANILHAALAQPEEQSVGDLYVHRLAVMLECALLDRPGSWDDAHALLDEYRTALRHYTIAFDKKRVSGFGKD